MRKIRRKIIKSFGHWAITNYGIECLTQFYPIEKKRISQKGRENWISHIRRKDFLQHFTFEQAFDFALEYFKAKGNKSNT
jgi:hypothetical protein